MGCYQRLVLVLCLVFLSTIGAQPVDSPLYYSLLKQKLECKDRKHSRFNEAVQQVSAIGLAVGCGIVAGTLLDASLCSDTTKPAGWLVRLFGTVVRKGTVNVTSNKTGVEAEGGIRLRTTEELKDAAKNVASAVKDTVSETKVVERCSIFKPLFCVTALGAYVLCRYLLREDKTPYHDVLSGFIRNWKVHKLRTPREFHAYFERLHASYLKHGELMMSEEVAMTTVRQITTVCTSHIIKELGMSDTDANAVNLARQQEERVAEKEMSLVGWQMLPTLWQLCSYFCT